MENECTSYLFIIIFLLLQLLFLVTQVMICSPMPLSDLLYMEQFYK